MDFAKKIKKERENLGITQEELAERAGLSKRSIVAYESQGVIARYKNIVKLASALQVAVEYLMNDDMQEPTYN